MIKQIKNILSGKTDFEKLFFTNEYQDLSRKNQSRYHHTDPNYVGHLAVFGLCDRQFTVPG